MKKRFVLITVLLMLVISAFTMELVQVNPNETKSTTINVLEAHEDFTVVEILLNHYYKDTTVIDGKEYNFLYLPSNATRLEAGNPELPQIANSLMIPPQAKMHVEVLEQSFADFSGSVVPSKGSILRSVNPRDVPFTFSEVYQTNAFFPENIVELNDPYILREFRGISFRITPITVNPVENIIRVYDRIVFKVYADGIDTIDVLPERPSRITRDFVGIYSNQFLNYNQIRSRSNLIEEQGSILVICYPAFMEATQPYVDWKNQKGIKTVMVPSTTAGATGAAIKTFITDYWTANPELAFVQIVGDGPQVPTINFSSWSSDPTYGIILGSNHYMDLIVGRFSAENIAQVVTQIERSIWYERDIVEGEWLNKAMGLAGNETGGHKNESDDQHMGLIRTLFLNNDTYSHVDGIYQPNANPTLVNNALNQGRALINYIAHGSRTGWHFLYGGGMDYMDTHVNALVNDWMLPHVVSVACDVGIFAAGTPCFAETWMRATNNNTGAPTGAIAFFGASMSQYWQQPMWGQDYIAEFHAWETYKTTGGLYFNGSIKMLDHGPNNNSWYDTSRTWHIFGDASLVVRNKVPVAMQVDAPEVLFFGLTDFPVIVDTPGALVALYNPETKELIASAHANNQGEATLILEEGLTDPYTLTLTITAYNKITYISEVMVLPNDGAYLLFDSFAFANDSDAVYGTTANLDVTVFNIGSEPADEVAVILTTNDEYITIIDNEAVISLVGAEEFFTIPNAFTIDIAENIPDQHEVQFFLNATRADDEWNMRFRIAFKAPVLNYGEPFLVEIEGNGNGRLDPGEIVELYLPFINTGHAVSSIGHVILNSNNPDVIVVENSRYSPSITVDGVGHAVFVLETCPDMEAGSRVNFGFFAEFSNQKMQSSFAYPVGLVIEDFETGDFEMYNWSHSIIPWTVSDDVVYEGQYSVTTGGLLPNQTSSLITSRTLTSPGVISFYYKVSSNPNQDHIQFYLNNALMGQWSGEVDWTFVQFPIPAGEHNFRWVYRKMSNDVMGQNRAWLDFITFPLSGGSEYTGPAFYVTVEDFDFSNAEVGIVSSSQFYLLNFGNGNLIGSVTVPEGFTLSTTSGMVLPNYIIAPDSNELFIINFLPTLAKDYSGNIVFTTNVNGNQVFTIPLNADLDPTPIDEVPVLVTELLGNYPNPFNPETTIHFSLAKQQNVQIDIYNIRGQLVKNLVNEDFGNGVHSVVWKGTDNFNRNVSSGVYFYRFVTDDYNSVNRMLLMK